MRARRNSGLTVIEVIVALALLGIISTAILGMFSLMASINRSASADVDHSRIVRSIFERTKLDWSLPYEWENERVAGVHISAYVRARSEDACEADVTDDSRVPDAVRVVTIVCDGSSDAQTRSYNLEFGRP